MRFDYHPPFIYRTRKFERIKNFIGLIVAIGCIILPIVHYEYAHTERKVKKFSLTDIQKPSLVIKQDTSKTIETIPIETKQVVKNITVKPGDTLSKIFTSVGIPSITLHEIVTKSPAGKKLSSIHPGQKLEFIFNANNDFQEIRVPINNTKTLHIRSSDSGYKFYYEQKQLNKRLAFSQGVISDSLYSAAQNAGLDDKLIMQMADIFGWDIDFSLDIRANDMFRIIYEEEYLDYEKVGSGKILAVEFINQGRTYQAVRYTDDNGRTGYFTPEGYSLQKAFLRTPVKFTRISSHFSKGRNHPVLHKIRAHKGVDYAAPHGTPIKASGDGRISFIGTKGGYGKSIEIRHGKKYSTFYAHLSRFSKNIKNGSFVKQGQVIGYVGRTGLATGDHLHYEFRINGVHRNPLTVKLPRSLPIAEKQKVKFTYHAKNMIDLLDTHENGSIQIAGVNFE